MKAKSVMVILLLALTSCSGAKKSETSEVTATEAVGEPEGGEATEKPADEPSKDQGEGIAWEEKSHEQKLNYMKMTVKPKMAAIFQAYDPEQFADFKCSTCHGENGRENNWEMPSAGLPKMDFAHWEKDHPKEMEFMKKLVVPEMAALLGKQPYNPETGQGFGCGGCHPR